MPVLKLTSRSIDALTSQAKRERKVLFVWDEALKGFGVRVAPSGQVSWLLQKWVGGRGGKSQRVTFAAKDLDDARRVALDLTAQASKGTNLPNRKREQRRAKRREVTAPKLSEAVATWIKRHRKAGRYWDEIQKRYDNQIIPALGKDTRLSELTKADVQPLIDEKLDAGQLQGARLTYAALNPFFSWAVSKDYLSDNPLARIKAPAPSQARQRILTDTELASLWQATAKLPLYGNFYRLLLLTLQRREEVAGIELREIDKTAKLWTIPGSRTKNGHPHLVPLSPLAFSVIEDAELECDSGSPFLFPVQGRDGDWSSISSYSDAKAALDNLLPADMPPWRTHDLRRTGRTNLSKLKIPREHAEKVLNHIPKDKLEAVYNLHEYTDEKRHALDRWGVHVSQLAEISLANSRTENNVIDMQRQRRKELT